MASYFEVKLKVNAPPEYLWRVLIDFEKYREWNPFVTEVDGAAEVGGRINLNIDLNLDQTNFIQSEEMVVSLKENSHLSYDSHVITPSLFNSIRWQMIHPCEDGKSSFYKTNQRFTGIGAWLMGWLIGEKLSEGFQRSSIAFKERAETLYQASLEGNVDNK